MFPIDDTEVDDQFTTHTYTLSNGNVVYSKGNDHIIQRTCPVCGALDGKEYPTNQFPQQPARAED